MTLRSAFAFFLTQYLVPALSTHFSFKPVLESYAKFAKNGEKIGRYRVEGHGSGFYGTGHTMVDLPSQAKLVDFLRDPERVFALVSADDLAALDNAFKKRQGRLYACHRRVLVALLAALESRWANGRGRRRTRCARTSGWRRRHRPA